MGPGACRQQRLTAALPRCTAARYLALALVWRALCSRAAGLAVKVPAELERRRQKRLDPSSKQPQLAWEHKTVSEKVARAIFTFEKAFGQYHGMVFWMSLAIRIS